MIAAQGCFGPGPPPAKPTEERVAANSSSFGIPYGQFILIRTGDRLVALRVKEAAGIGNQIDYEWYAPEPGSSDFQNAHQRFGTAVEGRFLGRIDAGPLSLNWSRGSAELGWIYWPAPEVGLNVCSRTFYSLDDIDAELTRLTFYSQEMFE